MAKSNCWFVAGSTNLPFRSTSSSFRALMERSTGMVPLPGSLPSGPTFPFNSTGCPSRMADRTSRMGRSRETSSSRRFRSEISLRSPFLWSIQMRDPFVTANWPTARPPMGRPSPGPPFGAFSSFFVGLEAPSTDFLPRSSQFVRPLLLFSRAMRGSSTIKRLTWIFLEIRGISFTLTSTDFRLAKSFSLNPGGFPRWISLEANPTHGKSERSRSPPIENGRPVASETIFSIRGL